jgi:hypothetical protein
MASFPVEAFRIDGDPGAIRGSAAKWQEFATQSLEAAAQIRALDTSLFIGPEGDQYREGLSASLPPNLEITGTAHGDVSIALLNFASSLDRVQDEIHPLAGRAPALWADLQNAHNGLTRSLSEDAAHTADRHRLTAGLWPGETLPQDNFYSWTGSANAVNRPGMSGDLLA